MANKTFWFSFGTGLGSSFTGLTPTMILFQTETGTTLAAPGITERITGTGAYQFAYDSTLSIFFRIDGGASVASNFRYIEGVLDPIQAVDQKVGTTTDSFGTVNTDPTTILGYVKRLQEFLEGNANFDKTSNIWTVYSRSAGATLAYKTLTDTSSSATKT
jgi:hypothetical protein